MKIQTETRESGSHQRDGSTADLDDKIMIIGCVIIGLVLVGAYDLRLCGALVFFGVARIGYLATGWPH